MTNGMPTFAVYKHRAFMGYVSAVSMTQAIKRAKLAYGRCEVLAADRVSVRDMGRDSYSHGRSPYPTPGFNERRAELIEAHEG